MDVSRINFILFTLSVLVALNACGPRYVMLDQFYPPTSSAGLSCVSNCQGIQASCNNNCQLNFEQCSRNAESDARLTLPTALQIYAIELASFDAQKGQHSNSVISYANEKRKLTEQYEAANNRCRNGKQRACEKVKILNNSIEDLYSTYYGRTGALSISEPIRPTKPDIRNETEHLIADRCTRSCNCTGEFKQCYSQCGGRVDIKKICVANCN